MLLLKIRDCNGIQKCVRIIVIIIYNFLNYIIIIMRCLAYDAVIKGQFADY